MSQIQLVEKELTGSIIGAFYEVYNTLGYGFMEHIYVRAMEWELCDRGHAVEREARVVVRYKNRVIGHQRVDLLVESKIVVECKATKDLHSAYRDQLLNYLRATPIEIGLLLHFGPEARFERFVCSNDAKQWIPRGHSEPNDQPHARMTLLPHARPAPRTEQ